ncbi:uncharacterized protein LOC111643801, partial [Copidosoma floridanum]
QSRPRELKDIQSMDQSLRTVATQLLNSTKREDLFPMPEEKIVTMETPMQVVQVSTKIEGVVNNDKNNEEDDSTKMKFGIPMNSKFGHFEISNPGHAIAMTDEEIEKEMATAVTADKKQLTTPSLLSTWIQLYPVSSTTENSNLSETKTNDQSNPIVSKTSTKLPASVVKQTITSTKPIRKTEPKSTTVKTTEFPVITKVMKNTSTSSSTNFVKIGTTTLTTSFDNDIDETETTDKKNTQPTPVSTTAKSSTKKSLNKSSTTPKLKLSTPKNSTINKSPKPNNSSNRMKNFSTKRPALSNDTVTSTSRIEKVTLRPLSTASQNHTESTDKPMFITKIRASLFDVQKSTTPTSTTSKSIHTILSKANFSQSESPIVKVPNPTRVNNVLKVHSKKPTDDTTKIEIQPIRVNPPVLTIEKISDLNSDQKIDDAQDILNNSKIDVKFDFDSEVSKVEIQTQPSVDSNTSPVITSTSKKPRSPGKRKKNKNRRRKTTTTSTTTSTTNAPSDEESQTSSDSITIHDLQVNGIQESKIEPESKISPSKKKKPNQQTQVEKPISSQIYNFISREVMPSVGVMSLVGLGLGLASYFLYPFGGVIARRNYNVEPNYKYNIDEYGGNYGLSEEEVLSKVYSGMTGGQNYETKYRIGEKSPNYYRYTASEHSHQPSTRYPGPTIKNNGNRVIYRPVETTAHGTNYRKTEFKYPEVSTTSNYYERQRQQQPTDFGLVVGKTGVGNNRQFVVGNIPKEYSREVDKRMDIVKLQDEAEPKLQYQVDETKDKKPESPSSDSSIENVESSAALVSKAKEEQSTGDLEDAKINSSGSLVEHGPRSLKLDDESKVRSTLFRAIRKKRGILPDLPGSLMPMITGFETPEKERNSVIQVIPSKSEIEKEKKEEAQEEDLSNEILDIIDEALPGKQHQKKHGDKGYMTAASDQHSKPALITTTASTKTTTSSSQETKTKEKSAALSTTTVKTTTTTLPTELDIIDLGETTLDWRENISTTSKPQPSGIDIIGMAKRIAEIKLRLGLTILKHASEGFAKYIGNIQKKFNGET